jgi:hypothetical protein
MDLSRIQLYSWENGDMVSFLCQVISIFALTRVVGFPKSRGTRDLCRGPTPGRWSALGRCGVGSVANLGLITLPLRGTRRA